MNAIETQPSNGTTSNHGKGNFMGSTLIDKITPKTFQQFAAAAVDFLKINSIEEKFRHGKPVVIKTRNGASEQIAESANLFFRLAEIPIRFWSKTDEWQRWEVDCFQLLNSDRFRAFAVRDNAVCVDKVPGRSVWDHMVAGTLTRQMMEAAANEFHRAHQLWSDEFAGPWSHADATMQNVIYDEKTGRARLIDFEMAHEKSLFPAARHADDLGVFLLDLVAKGPRRQWLPLAVSFLEAYGDRNVLAKLKEHLVVPSGLARIWWNVRTSFVNAAKVKRRVELLRKAIETLQAFSTVATERARKRRRPSMTCQVMSPGMPRPSSRIRVINERANAASPGIPSKLPTRT
jgi:hypothetical protein